MENIVKLLEEYKEVDASKERDLYFEITKEIRALRDNAQQFTAGNLSPINTNKWESLTWQTKQRQQKK